MSLCNNCSDWLNVEDDYVAIQSKHYHTVFDVSYIARGSVTLWQLFWLAECWRRLCCGYPIKTCTCFALTPQVREVLLVPWQWFWLAECWKLLCCYLSNQNTSLMSTSMVNDMFWLAECWQLVTMLLSNQNTSWMFITPWVLLVCNNGSDWLNV